MAIKFTDDLLFDKRLIKRHTERGHISDAQLHTHLSGLPDVAAKSQAVKVALDSMGVADVRARRSDGDE